MRWHIIRVLWRKELLRHLADRGSLALVLLLVVASLLLSLFGQGGSGAAGLGGGIRKCFVDYWRKDPWVTHLENNVPNELKDRIVFRHWSDFSTQGNRLVYSPGAGAIQIRHSGSECRVQFWHPGKDQESLAPFEAWYWREAYRFSRRDCRRPSC